MEIADYWSGLLMLAKEVKNFDGTIHYCFIKFGRNSEVHINRLPVPEHEKSMVLVELDSNVYADHQLANVIVLKGMVAHLQKNHDLTEEAVSFLCTYLPYCFLSLKAKKLKRAVTISHFAQSLDGKIATLHGDSKWIGNEENLTHAHRMRALCDSILIGAKTMNYDQPLLTVRLVEGENPRRVVICSSKGDFSSLQTSDDEPIILIGTSPDPCIPKTEYTRFPPNKEGRIACRQILAYLYKKGLYSVYVEGGAATSSQFMKEKVIDIMQLHISPVIFGSGINSFLLPEIERVQQGIYFDQYSFMPIGNTYMFIGVIEHERP